MAKLTSMYRKIYRESIEQKESKEIWLDGSKKLSRLYQEETQKSQSIENLSRYCRADRKQRNFARWIKKLSRFLSRLKKESSIEMNLSRSCRAWRRKFFQGRKNTKRWMQKAIYSTKDPINMLSSPKTCLNICAKHS